MKMICRLAGVVVDALGEGIRRWRQDGFPEQAQLDAQWRKIRAEQVRQHHEARRLRIGPYKPAPTVIYEEDKPMPRSWRKRA